MLALSNALDDYEVLDKIAAGGMAVVHGARHRKTRELVAVKFLLSQFQENSYVINGFAKEAETLKLFNHPNIVRFFAAGRDKKTNRYFIVMEYLKGLSFDQLPRRRTNDQADSTEEKDLPLEYILNIFIQCLDALKTCHDQDIVHRDIKPENIIILGNYREGQGKPKLFDFGIANSEEDEDLDSTVVTGNAMSLPWASPEQLSSKPTTKLSDIFSFGVLMYEKLTGKLPFFGKSQVDYFLQHIRWDVTPLRKLNKNIPQRLQEIVSKAMAKAEGDRFQSVGELIDALENLKKSYLLSKQALRISPYITTIRTNLLDQHEIRDRRKSIFEESKYVKQILSQYNLYFNRLKILKAKAKPPVEKIAEFKRMCEQLQQEHERIKSQLKMCLGFNANPVVIEKLGLVYKLPMQIYEKKGLYLNLASVEYFITFDDGQPIKIPGIDFTEKTRTTIKFHERFNNLKNVFDLPDSFWWFEGYEEKIFSTNIVLLPRDTRPSPRFVGISWSYDFFKAIRHFGKNGIQINFIFSAIDQKEKQVFARHKVNILFGANLPIN